MGEPRREGTQTPFPHLCAHRGLSATCPENTLPAFGAAVALGAHEIELDLWMTRDGVPVACHDRSVDRTTDGTGAIGHMDWDDLRRLDAGVRLGEPWAGVRMPRFEEVLGAVGGRTTLNIHLKEPGPEGRLVALVDGLLGERGLRETSYLAGDEQVLEAARRRAPQVARACLGGQGDPSRQIEVALQFGCRRVQFGRHVSPEQIRRAHEAGLICNLFWSDDPEDARAYVQKGTDVVLTNALHRLLAGGFAAA